MKKIAIVNLVFGVDPEELKEVFKPFESFDCNFYVSNILLKQAFNYHDIKDNKDTLEFLKSYDCKLTTEFTGAYNEIEARNLHFPFDGEELVWILDGDEFYTEDQIRSILQYVRSKPFVDVFNIPFKNYILDGTQYIKGFCPPRIYRSTTNSQWNFNGFYKDNDGKYLDGDCKEHFLNDVAQKNIPEKTVGGGVKHMTWLHANGEAKYKYQMNWFGHCSYKWNEKDQKIELDKNYYKKYNIPIPKIFKD